MKRTEDASAAHYASYMSIGTNETCAALWSVSFPPVAERDYGQYDIMCSFVGGGDHFLVPCGSVRVCSPRSIEDLILLENTARGVLSSVMSIANNETTNLYVLARGPELRIFPRLLIKVPALRPPPSSTMDLSTGDIGYCHNEAKRLVCRMQSATLACPFYDADSSRQRGSGDPAALIVREASTALPFATLFEPSVFIVALRPAAASQAMTLAFASHRKSPILERPSQLSITIPSTFQGPGAFLASHGLLVSDVPYVVTLLAVGIRNVAAAIDDIPLGGSDGGVAHRVFVQVNTSFSIVARPSYKTTFANISASDPLSTSFFAAGGVRAVGRTRIDGSVVAVVGVLGLPFGIAQDASGMRVGRLNVTLAAIRASPSVIAGFERSPTAALDAVASPFLGLNGVTYVQGSAAVSSDGAKIHLLVQALGVTNRSVMTVLVDALGTISAALHAVPGTAIAALPIGSRCESQACHLCRADSSTSAPS